MTINRDFLLRAAQIVRPALASTSYIPALTHLRFDGWGVTAYNDISALSMDIITEEVGFAHDLCVPGDLFIKALAGFSGRDVVITTPDGNSVQLKSGKGKIKLPTLPLSDFPFSWERIYDDEALTTFTINDEMLQGLRHCLISVGTNPHHPAQMGVTLDVQDGSHSAMFFSTDAQTITRFQTDTLINLPGDSPIILPTFWCNQLLALDKAFPFSELTVTLYGRGLLLEVTAEGSSEIVARLYTRQLVDTQPLDMPNLLGRHLVGYSPKELTPIPNGWEGALQRCMLIAGKETEPKVMINSDGGLRLLARSDYGEFDETLDWEGTAPAMPDTYTLNPMHLVRASDKCTHLFFGSRCFLMCSKDGALLHAIAYYPKPTKHS